MNMIEKVARNLAWAHWVKFYKNDSLLDDVTKENMYVEPDYFEQAKAAISAMREPSDEMIEPFLNTASDEYIKRCWSASIDAALKE